MFCDSVLRIPTGAEFLSSGMSTFLSRHLPVTIADSLRIYKAFQVYEQLRKEWNCFDRLGTFTGKHVETEIMLKRRMKRRKMVPFKKTCLRFANVNFCFAARASPPNASTDCIALIRSLEAKDV